MGLRAWQAEALEAYRLANPRDFLVTATPGAGKTTFALTVATKLFEAGAISQLIIICPTDHLRKQWGDNAIEKGIFLDPSLPNDNRLVGEDFVGYVATYAQVASNPGIHLRRATQRDKKTLVIFDEIHHAGDGLSWGDATRMAFEGAQRRLCLTGTPFRTSDASTIPFVKYRRNGAGAKESVADYTYGYREALKDHVVRPVTFAAYAGTTKWTNSAGDTLEAQLMGEDLSKKREMEAWRTALSPAGAWIPHVISSAHERLVHVRDAGMKDAGAMVLASDQDDAKEYAKVIKKVTGETPVIILSDDNKASKKIDEFSNDPSKLWLVAVRMVSEGVDVPRLAVGVWATNYRTPLFFAQAIGRFVRSRARGEVATVFLPAVRPLLALAASMEESRNHVITPPEKTDDLGEVELDELPNEDDERERGSITALESDAEFAHILYNGRAIVENLDAETEEYLGFTEILSPEQMATLLKKRDMEIKKKKGEVVAEEGTKKESNPYVVIELRKEINRMVSRAALSRNVGHGFLHKKLTNAVPGPPTAHAPVSVLEERLEWLQMNSI